MDSRVQRLAIYHHPPKDPWSNAQITENQHIPWVKGQFDPEMQNNTHRLLWGAYKDVEQQNEFDLLQIVEDLLGGY